MGRQAVSSGESAGPGVAGEEDREDLVEDLGRHSGGEAVVSGRGTRPAHPRR